MTNKERSWRKPIFRRLVFSFIGILLPVYLLSIVIYNWGIGTLRERIAETNINQVSFFLEGLEKDIERIQKLQLDCLSDSNLNRLASIPDSLSNMDRLQAMLNLRQRLQTIKGSSSYIQEVTVYIPSIEKTMTGDGPGPFDNVKFDELGAEYLKNGPQLVYDEKKIFLNTAYPYPYIYNGNKKSPLFIISIEISEEKIKEGMRSLVNGGDEDVVLYSPRTRMKLTVNESLFFDQSAQKQAFTIKQEKNMGSETVSINGKKYFKVYADSYYLGSIMYKYIPENSVFQPLRSFQIWFLLFAFVALAIILIYSVYLHEFINKPLRALAKSFKKIENGELEVRINYINDNEFGYIYRRFNAMVENLNTLIDQVYKQRILAQNSEMKQLQAQINPHFLYNSFFTLNAMIQLGDYENLEYFTKQLGDYFQFVTRNASDEVTLEKEVNHARIYTNIQAKRFAKRVKAEFGELPGHLSQVMVPRLILQPVIENAFLYGLEKQAQHGLLAVKFNYDEKYIYIIVEDNGDDLTEETLERLRNLMNSDSDDIEVTGMLNIYRRIRLKFGLESGISYDRGEAGGLRVTIFIEYAKGSPSISS